MNKFHSIVLGGALAFSLIGLAHAADTTVTGAWKLTVGTANAPCTVTLADGGDVTNTADCANGGSAVGHWKTVGTRLQLLSKNDELVAYLQPKGDTYSGKRVADGRTVELAR
jgi:hypothetical protein